MKRFNNNVLKFINSGFTLIELLAVIIILAVVALIATPLILDVIEDAEISANKSQLELIIDSAENLYAMSKLSGENEKLFDGTTNIYSNIDTSGKKPEYGSVIVTSEGVVNIALYMDSKCYTKIGNGDIVIEDKENPEDCAPMSIPPVVPDTGYEEGTIKSSDMIAGDLVAVKIDGTGNVTVADTTKEWFNYSNREWANAVILNDGVQKPEVNSSISLTDIKAYYVWIPRYEYQLFDTDISYDIDEPDRFELALTGGIKIRFTSAGTPMAENPVIGEYYTHPAFTIDDGTKVTEIPGFWVGKFELTGTLANPTVLPNVTSLRGLNEQVTLAGLFNSVATIDGDITETDSHMLKNMEWGAIAYLAYSVNGRCSNVSCSGLSNNTNSSYLTGSGDYANQNNYEQSTTGNVTGVYDLSGGVYEYVMGFKNQNHLISSGFDSTFFTGTNQKYYDEYIFDDSLSTFANDKFGDATVETLSWNGDNANYVTIDEPWFLRGGRYRSGGYAGMFSFYRKNGAVSESDGTRAALWVYPQ